MPAGAEIGNIGDCVVQRTFEAGDLLGQAAQFDLHGVGRNDNHFQPFADILNAHAGGEPHGRFDRLDHDGHEHLGGACGRGVSEREREEAADRGAAILDVDQLG